MQLQTRILVVLTACWLSLVAAGPSRASAVEWITVSPHGFYFQTESGEPFLVVGQNDAITWPYLSDLLLTKNADSTEAYLKALKAHGVNTMRVMLEYAQYSYGLIEDPLGEWDERVVAFWDRFIELAEAYDMHLIVTPWDPFWMQRNWSRNPYFAGNGGIMPSMRGFLTDPEAKEAQKRRFAFMVDRWGGSPAILAWELMNEIELWWGASPAEIAAWIDEMADFVRRRERERYGRTHLLTVSTATPYPDRRLAKAVLDHPKLDFATTHQYTGAAINRPENTVDAASDVRLATLYARSQISDDRPYIDSESGPIDRWIADGAFDTEYYHNMSWAHLMSGGAGQGLRWPYRTPHVLSDDMRRVQLGLARFIEAFPWDGFRPRPIGRKAWLVPVDGNGDQGSERQGADIEIFGIWDEQRAALWLLDTAPRHGASPGEVSGYKLVLDREGEGRDDVRLDVSFWDTYAGARVDRLDVTAGWDRWEIPLPPFRRDLAVSVTVSPAPESAGANAD